MADPFLLAHQVAESAFDIGGKLYPVSIRDQMVRAQSIIDRAMAAGYKGTGKELLIIGAGAAGVAAAIQAVIVWGVRTHLIDADTAPPAPFGRQRSCKSRWIDPYEYEWPADQFSRHTYPYHNPPLHPYYGLPVPLPWTADWAKDLVIGWDALFTAARARAAPLFSFCPGTTLAGPAPPAFHSATKLWTAKLSTGPVLNVGMILFAVGFGAERCDIPPFRSLAFWETDVFRTSNCGLKPLAAGKAPPVAKVVISGGGDGALQDFLRIMTGRPSARRLYGDIMRALPTGKHGAIRARIEGRLGSAENRAMRSFIWGANVDHDHDVHRTLHAAHNDVVQWALGKAPVLAALGKVLPPAPPDVNLVYPCIHFTQAYPFNRFLTLLVDAYYAKNGLGARLIPGASVIAVAPPRGHLCRIKRPKNCLGIMHTLTLAPSAHASCTAVVAPPVPPPTVSANVILIRHGVTGPGPAPAGFRTIGHGRHHLPVHCS
jgi:hypothetical protein